MLTNRTWKKISPAVYRVELILTSKIQILVYSTLRPIVISGKGGSNHRLTQPLILEGNSFFHS